MHFSGRVALKAIVTHNGAVLVVRNRGEETWDLPGGHINDGEKPDDGIRREVEEETGLVIKKLQPFVADTFIHALGNHDSHFVLIYLTEAETDRIVPQDNELEEWRWITKDELDSVRLFPEYLSAIQKYFE
jgi:8-oxo-dGTP diphosphatase